MRSLVLVLLTISFAAAAAAQPPSSKRSAKIPAKRTAPAKTAAAVDPGKTSGKTYRNDTFRFEITFPDTWLIPDSDFEAYMKAQGFDLSMKAPENMNAVDRVRMNKALQRVTMLVTAYRSLPGSEENAIMRVAAENLKDQPQIADAVDYVDAIRSMYAGMRLPADFKYSDTQAEKLGRHQFAFIDTETKEGTKRTYVTVRDGYALLFTLTYTLKEDLETMRKVLADGTFDLAKTS